MAGTAHASAPSWHLVTGEFPPQPGGVSDYTQQLARALASAGEEVHVWAPDEAACRSDGSVTVHGLSGFGPSSLSVLSQRLAAIPGRRRLVVQYVATAYGFRGMNLAFAFWLASRTNEEVWVQFHEVGYGFSWRQRPQRNLLAAVEWWMAQLAAGRAERIFISIPAWRRQLGRHGYRAEVLPIPSNVAIDVRQADIERVLTRLGPGPLIGHFGTYGTFVGDLLYPAVVNILRAARDARFVLLGRGGLEFAGRLVSAYPDLGSRIVAPGALSATEVSCHLAACDVLVQPYPDGISGRRTSAMAGLSLGKPLVTTTGPLTESEWASSGAVVLVPVGEPLEVVSAVIRLLASRDEQNELGARARAWYQARFSIEYTLASLGVVSGSGKVEPCPSVP
jgi:glycosyltransferase involved in cell wall biosynthesis